MICKSPSHFGPIPPFHIVYPSSTAMKQLSIHDNAQTIAHSPEENDWIINHNIWQLQVPFFIDVEDRPGPIAPFLPRENPRAWVKNSLSLRSHSDGKKPSI